MPFSKTVATIDPQSRTVKLRWSDSETQSYDFIWLRHSARCPDGMSNDTLVKIDLLPTDPASLAIESIEVDQSNLMIQWQDNGLKTRHGLASLKQAGYDTAARNARKHRPVLWNGSQALQRPVFDFSDLADQNNVLLLLEAVRDHGLARVQNLPTTPGSIEQVARLFGPIHVNNYGRVFDVRTGTNVTLGSNTGAYLGPHTDESYRHAPPGISMFHCLEASQQNGGESILVDGFNAAEILRQTDSDSFEILTRYPVFFQRLAPPEEDMQSHARVIVTDIDGDVVGIRFTDRTFPPQDLPAHLLDQIYKAIKAYWDIVNTEQLKLIYRMQPGDLHVFDNHRVLHGRTAFEPGSGKRFLQQCSVNRDEFHNNLRILGGRLGRVDTNMILGSGANG